ncbi:piercer of microtubule wall 1 protein-like [Ptiloglossa arizonensis]|uniref:piercer of microtubule wall 1 protein-like n=1 Tax=Ptiloglossa arizonensis TaxID=3350558 RepID=UPI003FA19215
MRGTRCVCSETKAVEEKGEKISFGSRTNDVYRTCNLPTRFMYPRIITGYRENDGPLPHPCYRSTSMDYGWYAPTVHTVPTRYYPRSTSFSEIQSRGGMYRNCSLNTELDKTVV